MCLRILAVVGLNLAFAAIAGAGDKVRHDPQLEKIPLDEAVQIKNVVRKTVELMKMRYPADKSAPPLRGVHPKDHGCVLATFRVLDDLPPELRVGVFAKSGREYKAWVRFSNADVLVRPDSPDMEHGSRGMAIKLLNVEGTPLLKGYEKLAQDFLMVNQPVFAFSNVEDYEALTEVLLKDNDKAGRFFQERMKKKDGKPDLTILMSKRAFRTFEIISRVKSLSVTATPPNAPAFQNPPASPVDNTYFSAAPFLFGSEKVMKYSAKPIAPSIAPPDLNDPGYLRTALLKRLTDKNAKEVVFDFRVQVRSKVELANKIEAEIEDACFEWDESKYPFRTVARITILPQDFNTDARKQQCEELFFSPWHSVVELQPIGGINRMRLGVYEASSTFRHAYADERRNAKIVAKDDFDQPVTEVKYLEQGWSPTESMRFYSLPQGSKLIPYRWFLSLEQAQGQELFASPDNMNRLRYLPLNADPTFNPDGLPVGFVREPKQPGDPLKTDWLGFTCAACHTAEIRFNKVAYRIDGGPAMADHDTFLQQLVAAMKATFDDDTKFARFAEKVLGPNANNEAKVNLKDDFRNFLDFRIKYNERNRVKVPYGFARLDAFGRIMNETFVRHIQVDDANQFKAPDAPVSYPQLWGITKHDRVQWNGIAQNTKLIVGPLGRNVGEVLGVFGEVDVPVPRVINFGFIKKTVPDFDLGFDSSVRFGNLLKLEDSIDSLKPPRWEEIFGKLDKKKLALGKELFEKHCVTCHNPEIKDGFVRTTLTAIASGLNTDKRMAENFALRKGRTGNMIGRLTKAKKAGLDLGVFGNEAPAGALLVGVVERTILGADPKEFAERANLPKFLKDAQDFKTLAVGNLRKLEKIKEILTGSGLEPYLKIDSKEEDLLVYRGRPLEGIWATAPYLHNGSVPNLDELLRPVNERSKVFHVGSRDFDPDKVGFRTDRGFRFDTSLPGNSNLGHDTYGRSDLDDPTKRVALLEYLKSL